MDEDKLKEFVLEMAKLRHKFHTEHHLDKEESDRFDTLLDAVVKIVLPA